MNLSFSFIDKKQENLRSDFFSGLTVALALVPEAVAFSFIAGISPVIGLYGAFMMGACNSHTWWAPGNDIRSHRSNGSSHGKPC